MKRKLTVRTAKNVDEAVALVRKALEAPLKKRAERKKKTKSEAKGTGRTR